MFDFVLNPHNPGSSNLNQQLLFGPSLEEVAVREGRGTAGELAPPMGLGGRLGLGLVLLLLGQCSRQFSQVGESSLGLLFF